MHLELQVFGRKIELKTKGLQLAPLSSSGNGWWPAWGVIRESFTGAWQQNVEIRADTALSYFAVYACHRLITTDMGKMCLRLVEQDRHGVWTETESPAFSPVIRKPNRYQTINKYIEQYILSKLIHGNAYVLKQRDQRGVVTGLYVLDPSRVTVLQASDGSVYYSLKRDPLSNLPLEEFTVPAREIIHDTMITPFHPLIGVSPLYACWLAAQQGITIQNNSNTFFSNGSNPSGMLTAPGAISDETAARLLATITAKRAGDTLVAGDGLKFEKFTMSATDAQLIEQLRMTAEQVCSAHGVPPYLVDIGPPPPYANFEPLLLKYHSQCIQSLTTNFEKCHDEGLGLLEKIDGRQLGVEFDIDDLIWMDTATRSAAAQTAITSGLSFNEVRKKFYGVGPVKGGESPLSQQQNFSIAALAERDANDPFAKPTPQQIAPPAEDVEVDDEDEMEAASFAAHVLQKTLAGLHAA